MSPMWSRVWGPTTGCAGSCPSSCYNPTSTSSSNGNILDNFPLSIQTCGQAVAQFAEVLKTRVGANTVIVSSSGGSAYVLDVRKGPKVSDRATVNFNFSTSTCNFPIRVSFSQGARSGETSFTELGQVLEWLAVSLQF
jgi:hypothetical protein